MLRLKEGPNQPGPELSTQFIYFVQFFFNQLLISGSPLHTPPNFLFSRPHFATLIRDSRSRLPFATPLVTPVRDSRSRLPFATHVRDSDCDSCL